MHISKIIKNNMEGQSPEQEILQKINKGMEIKIRKFKDDFGHLCNNNTEGKRCGEDHYCNNNCNENEINNSDYI